MPILPDERQAAILDRPPCDGRCRRVYDAGLSPSSASGTLRRRETVALTADKLGTAAPVAAVPAAALHHLVVEASR